MRPERIARRERRRRSYPRCRRCHERRRRL